MQNEKNVTPSHASHSPNTMSEINNLMNFNFMFFVHPAAVSR